MVATGFHGHSRRCPHAASCNKGAEMWHLSSHCDLTCSMLGILRSRPAKSELVFRITQLLSLLLACLHFFKHSPSLAVTTSTNKMILTVKDVLWVAFGVF